MDFEKLIAVVHHHHRRHLTTKLKGGRIDERIVELETKTCAANPIDNNDGWPPHCELCSPLPSPVARAQLIDVGEARIQ